MSHCNTDKFNYFWICEPLARCAKRGSSLPLGTPMEIDFTSSYLHYPLPQCSKIVTPIIFSISYELFRLPSAKIPQDYQLLRTFVWKSWPGTMGHFLILIIFTLFSKQVNNFCHASGGSFLFVLYKIRWQFSPKEIEWFSKKWKASSPKRKILPSPPPQISSICKIWKQAKRHSVMIRYIAVVPISAHFSMSASLEVRSLIRKTVVYVSVLQLFFFLCECTVRQTSDLKILWWLLFGWSFLLRMIQRQQVRFPVLSILFR